MADTAIVSTGYSSPGVPGAGADGFFSIRFESIGGLGAHLAGQILAEAVVLRQGLNGSQFSSYGSEKKGTPVKSFLRFCATDREIRTSSPVESPQVVAVFHEALAHSGIVAAGLGPTGTIVVNTVSTPDAVRELLGLRAGTVTVVDALGIAVEEGTRPNMAMLGAVVRTCPFVDPDAVRETMRATFARRYAHLVDANIATFDRGYKELKRATYRAAAGEEPGAPTRAAPSFGYLEAPIGGTILDPGNSIVKNMTTSRTGFLPALTSRHACTAGSATSSAPTSASCGRRRTTKPFASAGSTTTTARAACGAPPPVRPARSPSCARRRATRTPIAFPCIPGSRRSEMAVVELTRRAAQVEAFKTGNEMAALSASQIGFHVMGYYPITPSTEIAELLDEMKAEGHNSTVMVPADGEHGAAGICYGASTGGGRVFNATSSQGLLYSLEELPVQSGTRFPMLLDLATRSVSGPLDIRGDHSDLYFALNTGWIIFLARDPQAVYDLNLIALRVAEQPEVQLPAIVAFDGFFTSHQKRRVQTFADARSVQEFLGPVPERVTALDPRHPVTIGPYMNDPDLINNKYQLKLAMDAARRVIPEVFAEYEALSGRRYPVVDLYRMEDADVAVLLLNSAAETAKDVADSLREQGVRAGVISPNVIRPFPVEEIQDALRRVRAVLIGERADSYGGNGANISHEVKSALKDDPVNATRCLTRVYGLGGSDFYADDAEAFFDLALEAAETGHVETPFDYHGVVAGRPGEAVPGAGSPGARAPRQRRAS